MFINMLFHILPLSNGSRKKERGETQRVRIVFDFNWIN
jgi:hypothetical protein